MARPTDTDDMPGTSPEDKGEELPPASIYKRPRITRSQVHLRFNASDVRKIRRLQRLLDAPASVVLREAVRVLFSVQCGEVVARPKDSGPPPMPVFPGTPGVKW